MKITKVSLVEGGLGGIKTDYTTTTTKSGFLVQNTFPGIHYKGMVHEALKSAISSLKKHLVAICLLDESEDTANAVEVTGIVSDCETKFLLTGKVRTFDNKVFALNTPLIQDGTEYAQFQDILNIAEVIFTEAKSFIVDADKSGTYEQILLEHAKQTGQEIDVSGMGAAELQERAEDILENKGSFKMADDMPDLSGDEDDDDNEGLEADVVEETIDQEKEVPVEV